MLTRFSFLYLGALQDYYFTIYHINTMEKTIVIAGGTGFVGNYFAAQFRKNGYRVIIISRQQKHVQWGNQQAIIAALENAEMLINLAGKSVNCRYNDANKQEILLSRTNTTKELGDAILLCQHPPKLWINSSTATIYRHAEDRPMTEQAGELGSGFSVGIAKAWEAAFFGYTLPKTRLVALRIAIVLGKDGGVMIPYINMVKWGLGGTQGKGTQKFSFIHIADLYSIVCFIQAKEQLTGVFNCSTPNPINNKELMIALRQAMKMPIGVPAPVWLLKIGAVLIKTETELILKSRWVIPERLLAAGFSFQFPTIDKTLKEIIG